MGVNLGEAVNFAPGDWLRFGAAALGRLRYFRKPCVVSQEEMLLRVAAQQGARSAAAAHPVLALPNAQQQAAAHSAQQNGVADAADAPVAGSPASPAGLQSPGHEAGPSPLLCYYLRQELRRVVDEEWVLRAKLWSQGERCGRRLCWPRQAATPCSWAANACRAGRWTLAHASMAQGRVQHRTAPHTSAASPLQAASLLLCSQPASSRLRRQGPNRRSLSRHVQACVARGAPPCWLALRTVTPTTPSALSATCTCTSRQVRAGCSRALWPPASALRRVYRPAALIAAAVLALDACPHVPALVRRCTQPTLSSWKRCHRKLMHNRPSSLHGPLPRPQWSATAARAGACACTMRPTCVAAT